MRLGQLARKYGVSKREIISFLNQIDPSLHSLGNNTKLDQQTVMQLGQHFEHLDQFVEKEPEQESQPQQQEPDAAEEIESAEVPADQVDSGHEPLPQPPKEGESIETDKLLEMLESEETTVDLDKITLIKAPKKQLGGLKVLGKIELPEPKSKVQATIKGKKQDASTKSSGQQLSEQEREKRRLKAKRSKEAHQARYEKRQKEREERRKKAEKKARYQHKMARAKSRRPKSKPAEVVVEEQDTQLKTAPPKTLLGKFWRWLTTY